MRNRCLSLIVVLGVAAALTGCVAPQAASRQKAGVPGQRTGPQAPRILTVAINREPVAFFGFGELGGGTSSGEGGLHNPPKIAHDNLVRENDKGVFEPRLAAEGIAVEGGTWRVNADGTMDTIWKLRPNVKWQDGTPFTSGDLLFAFELRQDKEISTLPTGTGRADLRLSAAAPDPLTFEVHWRSVYVRANEASGMEPLPRHLLQELYQRDKNAFTIDPYFTTAFVGLGPYRLDKWEQGSHMEFVRFDDFYMGRPALDRIIVRFVADPNTMVANILSGVVDAVLPTGVSIDAAIEVKRLWEGTDHGVQTYVTGRLYNLEPQHRAEHTRPRNGLNAPFRQALYHATDRPTLIEVVTHGLAPLADSYIRPTHGLRREVESAIPQFPYDLARAERLLVDSGWARGADGILVHQPSGERFSIEVWARGAKDEPVATAIADGWRQIGAEARPVVIPPARASDREYEATHSGPLLNSPTGENFFDIRLHPQYIASSQNRWTGGNRAGYNNPRVEVLMDRLAVSIDSQVQVALHREMLQEAMGDVGLMPLWWETVPVLSLKGVRGLIQVGNDAAWNIFNWDKD